MNCMISILYLLASFLATFLKKVASQHVIFSKDSIIVIIEFPSHKSFAAVFLVTFVLDLKVTAFSILCFLSSTFNIGYVVTLSGIHEVKVMKRGFYLNDLTVFACFYSSLPVVENNVKN